MKTSDLFRSFVCCTKKYPLFSCCHLSASLWITFHLQMLPVTKLTCSIHNTVTVNDMSASTYYLDWSKLDPYGI